ncbi:hypothetical protein ACH427_04470 [Streptomyces sp. NPDC020379]|uniref:hypothetical protein n=1 Tax=Streptomyces sp. NPDC020379 TaxID=3365071 RepID=UPI0037A321C3
MHFGLENRPDQNDDSGHYYQVLIWGAIYGSWYEDLASTDQDAVREHARRLIQKGAAPDHVRIATIDYVIEEV